MSRPLQARVVTANGLPFGVLEAGYFLQVEQPTAVNDRILAWVSA
jgi:hypothetical protein